MPADGTPTPLLRVDETLREVANDGDLSGFGVSELRSLLGGSWWLCHWRDPRKHPWRVLGVFTRVTTAPSSWVWLLNLRAAPLMWARFPSLEIWLADGMLGGTEALALGPAGGGRGSALSARRAHGRLKETSMVSRWSWRGD